MLIKYFTSTIGLEKLHFGVFFTILAMAIFVRLAFLFQPMRYDEAFTFTYFASKPLSEGLSNYFVPNNHLFHTFLQHLAYVTFGNRPWVLRLPALLAGILLVPASYVVARMFYDKNAALLAAGLVASSSILVEYSTNARGYTLIALIFLVLLAVSAHLVRGSTNLLHWILFGVLGGVGFYTIPIMLYPYGVLVSWLFLTILFERAGPFYPRSLLLLGLSVGVTALVTLTLYSPVLMNAGLDSIIHNRFVTPVSLSDFGSGFLPSLRLVWQQWTRDVPTAVIIVLGFGFSISLAFHNRISAFRVPLVGAAFLWLTLVLLVHPVVPFSRVWLFLLPLSITLSSSGVAYGLALAVRAKNLQTMLSAGISLAMSFWLATNVFLTQSVIHSDETGTLLEAESITLFLKDYLKPGDKVLATVPSDAPLEYYFDLHDVPVNYLFPSYNQSDRLWIVVNRSHQQSLRDVVERKKISTSDFGSARLLRSYGSAFVYRMERLK